MNEKNNKDELIQLVEASDLDSISESYLKHKLDLNRIIDKEKFEALEKINCKIRIKPPNK